MVHFVLYGDINPSISTNYEDSANCKKMTCSTWGYICHKFNENGTSKNKTEVDCKTNLPTHWANVLSTLDHHNTLWFKFSFHQIDCFMHDIWMNTLKFREVVHFSSKTIIVYISIHCKWITELPDNQYNALTWYIKLS